MAGKTSLKQIAEKSGVSMATVSQILNNRSQNYSSEETKLRVRSVAEELGYQVNFGYKLMRGQKTKTVAILNSMPEMNSEEYVLKLTMLLIAGFDKIGYSAYCNTFSDSPAANLEKVRTLINRGVEHFVLLGCPFGYDVILEELAQHKLPVISKSRTIKRYVHKDSLMGAEVIFRNIMSRLGNDNFKFICQRQVAKAENDRIRALQNIFPELTLQQILDRYVFCHDNIDFGVEDFTQTAYEVSGQATIELLKSFPDIGAICYLNDTMAVGGGRILLSHGYEKYRHILLAGFNNNDNILRNFPLPVTSVSFDLGEMARLLIQNALHLNPCQIMLYPRLHVRTATAESGGYPGWTEEIIDYKPQGE